MLIWSDESFLSPLETFARMCQAVLCRSDATAAGHLHNGHVRADWMLDQIGTSHVTKILPGHTDACAGLPLARST
jgi:hypothetical protein